MAYVIGIDGGTESVRAFVKVARQSFVRAPRPHLTLARGSELARENCAAPFDTGHMLHWEDPSGVLPVLGQFPVSG